MQTSLAYQGPLAGVRVLDLSSVIFGPMSSQVLADYGAEVIKIEPPSGDSTRHTGPAVEKGMAAMFLGSNRSKKSVMLDLKQMNDEIHQNLIGVSNHRTLEFARYLSNKNINVWIRYVVVPGWSDDDDSAHRLGEFTRDMGNVEKIELLPYHELGKHKWVAMGEEYKLDGVHPPKKETMERVKGILEQYGHKVMY